MNDSMQQTQTAQVSTTTQTADQPTDTTRTAENESDRIHRIYAIAYRDGLRDAEEGLTVARFMEWRKECAEVRKTCPPWCNDHQHAKWNSDEPENDGWHQHTVELGDDEFQICVDEGVPSMWLPQSEAIPLPVVREWIAAMQKAMDEFERLT